MSGGRSQDFAPNFAGLLGRRSDPTLEEYGRFQQHLVLLEDAGRLAAYCAALEHFSPGDVVVDVGAGTGVLGLLALKRGFQRAILIEPSRKMGAYARHLAAQNGLQDRVTIVSSTLEALDLDELPRSIDLVVTETLSSLLFGFGSWDALPSLTQRLSDQRRVIPARGRLFAAPSRAQLATRGPSSDGLAVLRDAGLTVDLFERTFRSGGNVYDKAVIVRMLADGALRPVQIASFDFTRDPPIMLDGGSIGASDTQPYCGMVTFFEVDLAATPLERVSISSLDPRVSSWYPFYVPFVKPARGPLRLRLRLIPLDAPYKYAFQFLSGDEELTHVLYW